MSGIINQVGAKSGIISGDSAVSAGTVTLSGTTELDYEEGTWLPAYGTSGNTSYTVNNRGGLYVKVGRLVIATGYLASHSTGGSGNVTITGLPYTSSSATATYTAVHIGQLYEVDLTGHHSFGYVNPGTNVILLYFSQDNAVQEAWDQTRVADSSNGIQFSVSYHT